MTVAADPAILTARGPVKRYGRMVVMDRPSS